MPESSKELTALQAKLVSQILYFMKVNNVEVGYHLTESGVGEQFGVSRSPVRAALQYLADQGVLRSRPNQGFFLNVPAAKLRSEEYSVPDDEIDALYMSIALDHVRGDVPDRFSESDFMRRYEVGRGQLLQALRKLADDGIVRRSEGYGWSFMPLINSDEAAADSYRFRMIVEPHGILLPTFKLIPEHVETARNRHRALMKMHPGKVSLKEMFEMNADFHEMLARFSNNRFVVESIQQQNRLRRLVEYSYPSQLGRVEESCREHLEILDALEEGNRDWAASLMTRHLQVALSITSFPKGDKSK